ncbi:hypothetical protein KSP40_PGU019981 [Platanthera guangdongensis]|uniref:Uncharacterized protein n=1 Tax=Platanthera guangdongensis TaxID=2320717 RepID=A0ABR2MKN9_9ASPA
MTGESRDQWTVTEPLIAGDERAETGEWRDADIEEIRSNMVIGGLAFGIMGKKQIDPVSAIFTDTRFIVSIVADTADLENKLLASMQTSVNERAEDEFL